MKNIQVIDGAINSIFEIYQVSDDLFDLMFPNGTDIAFIDDIGKQFRAMHNERRSQSLWNLVYRNRVDKKRVRGIHGTVHLKASVASKRFFRTRKEAEVRGGKKNVLRR